MSALRRFYGAGPVHLVALLVSLAVSAEAIVHWFDLPGPDSMRVLLWFVGAIVVHDLVVLPLYTLLDVVGRRLTASSSSSSSLSAAPRRSPGWVYVRVPLVICAILGIAFLPEIARLGSATYHVASGSTQDRYLVRYAITCAVVLGASALAYALSRVRARRGKRRARSQER